ncbi:MAG: hypothetical protein AB7F19_07835 [Candidatus Babeliales bacterium]
MSSPAELLAKSYGGKYTQTASGWMVQCPNHADSTPSCAISDGDRVAVVAHCFAGCADKDVYMAFKEKHHYDLSKGEHITPKAPKADQLQPWPDDTAPPSEHHKLGKPHHGPWPYRKPDGTLIGYVYRWNTEPKKTLLPMTWRGNKAVWRGFDRPLPLYWRGDINQAKTIVIVEGETCVDILAPMMSKSLVVTWPGGVNQVLNTKWDWIGDRKVYIWPDNDAPGMKAAQDLKSAIPQAIIIPPPANKPEGWDAVDAVKESFNIRELFTSAPIQAPAAPTEPSIFKNYVIPLGYDHDEFYYYSSEKGQVIGVGANMHKPDQLVSLAPLELWKDYLKTDDYPTSNSWAEARNAMMRMCHKRGVFDPSYIRGIGAWEDAGKLVYHLGDRLWINGKEIAFSSHPSRFTYSRRPVFGTLPPPADQNIGEMLFNCASQLNWQLTSSPYLLTGWLFLAPLCGILEWRPHIWITGEAGSGKSEVLKRLLRPLLEGLSLNTDGASSAAGIRDKIRYDARPVIFDEAGGDTDHASMLMQNVLLLARGGNIIKGTQSGGSNEYNIRSMFCFASVAHLAHNQQDASRVCILNLKKDNPEEKYAEFLDLSNQLKPHGDALIHRALSRHDQLKESIATIHRAILTHISDARLADQLSTLLAGYHTATHDEAISAEQAVLLLQSCDIFLARPNTDRPEHLSCLDFLLSRLVDIGNSAHTKMSIAELFEMAESNIDPDAPIIPTKAEATLRRYGFGVMNKKRIMAPSHPQLQELLKGTPWHRKSDMLTRLSQSNKTEKCSSKFAGVQCRYIVLNNSSDALQEQEAA